MNLCLCLCNIFIDFIPKKNKNRKVKASLVQALVVQKSAVKCFLNVNVFNIEIILKRPVLSLLW